MRKSISWLVSIGACAMFLAFGVCTVKNVQAETETYRFSEYHGDLNNIKAPVQEGHVFAGWYDSEGNPAPKSATQGDYEAKFVDDDVLKVIWQVTKDTTKESQSTHLRLITSVDTLKYTEVGFDINGYEEMARDVYDMIVADGEPYDPKSKFHDDSEWFATFVLENATNNLEKADGTELFGATFRVTPQWETLDGTLVKGKTRDICINDELGYEARVENLTGAGTKADKVWYDKLEDAVNAANGKGGTTEGVVTVLQDAEIEEQLNLSTRNMTIQNKYGKNVTISRAEDFTGLMIYCSGSGKTQKLITAENDAEGSLTVDATTMDVVSSSVVKLGSSATSTVKFYLGEGVTITGANSDCDEGTVIYVQAQTTANLYGNITNNTSTNDASSLIHCTGTVTIGGGTYSGNSGVNGGVVYVTDTGKLTISDGTFNQNTASGNGGVVYGVGTLDISGGQFNSNIANGTQGGGVVYATNTLEISNGIFDNNQAYNGGVVFAAGTTTTISGGEFKNHTTMTQTNGSKGGVVFVNAGTLNITGGTFTNNSARLGGVAFNATGATVEFKDGTFNQNTASGNGAVVYGAGTVSIQGGEFTSNVSNGTQGGGVVYATNTLAISNGTFDNNQAYNGGVVYATGTTTTISGGEFKNHTTMTQNQGSKGGVVYVGAGTLQITGGTFTSNNARLGGVVCNSSSATAEFDGGTFSSNSASGNGGVVWTEGSLSVIKGTFEKNHANYGGVVYYNKDAETTISTGTFSENYASISGGVVYVNKGSIKINNGTFDKNYAPWGGVVYTIVPITIYGGTFDTNSATTGRGGAVIASNKGTVSILGTSDNKVVFKNNYVGETSNSNNDGGGGAINLINDGTLTLQNCEFTNNLHVGDTAGTGTTGCDIVFVRDYNQTLILNDESFNGVVKIVLDHTKFAIKEGDNSWSLDSTITAGLYNVDYTNKNLVPVSTTK